MKIFNYLLIFIIIKLYKSFSLNIKTRHNLILNMGCDYYIDKSLYIYDYNDKTLSYITLEESRGYYSYYKDEDETDYDYESYKTKMLEPSFKPIIIYVNNSFTKLCFEKKYEKLINYELKICNKTWDDIDKIIKKEERYKR